MTVSAVPEQENSVGPSRLSEEVHDRLWFVRVRHPVASRTTARPVAAASGYFGKFRRARVVVARASFGAPVYCASVNFAS